MHMALEEAIAAGEREEVPVGAVLYDPVSGTVIARDGNRSIELNDPSAHAEMVVIRKACREQGAQRIPGMHLYVTLEPCAMCAAAISFARISAVFFGAFDPKGGAVVNGPRFYEQPTCHHRPFVLGGIEEDKSAEILRKFFKARR